MLQQGWRLARLFTVAFVAQWQLLPSGNHFQRTALVSAAVAAAEATYRQVSPTGSANVLTTISRILTALASAATDGSSVRTTAPPPKVSDGSQTIKVGDCVIPVIHGSAASTTALTAQPVVVTDEVSAAVKALDEIGPKVASVVAPVVSTATPAQAAAVVAAQSEAPSQTAPRWPADAPTGPDGQPLHVVGH